MGKHRIRILGTTALVALAVGTAQAVAGGLALREQSAWGEGTSYAGVAAGGSLSAMYWNPATITQSGKLGVELSTSILFPESSQVGSLTFLNPHSPPSPPSASPTERLTVAAPRCSRRDMSR